MGHKPQNPPNRREEDVTNNPVKMKIEPFFTTNEVTGTGKNGETHHYRNNANVHMQRGRVEVRAEAILTLSA